MSEAPDLETLLRHFTRPTEALSSLARFGAKQRAWTGWTRLPKLDFAADEERLAEWVADVLDEERPPLETQAFFFGLFDAEDSHGKQTLGLEWVGSSIFVPFDSEFSWARDPTWVPEDRFAPEGVLDEIHRLARSAPRDMREFACYTIGLAYATLVIQRLGQRFREELQLWSEGGRQIAVGFVTGDAILLPDPDAAGDPDDPGDPEDPGDLDGPDDPDGSSEP